MRILVVGAGLAGSAVAVMLAGHGHEVQVVDAAAQPYSGGYQILLDTTAMAVLEDIGARPVVTGLSAPAAAITVVRRGRTITTIDPTGYRSARRGDLVGAVSRYAADMVPMRFGRELVALEQQAAGVTARFADGHRQDYNLIIGADGLHSTVRRLAVETDRSFVYDNGRINLWVNVPGRVAGTTQAGILLAEGVGAQVFPYTDRDETLVVTCLDAGARRYDAASLLPLAADLLRASGGPFAGFADPVLAAPVPLTRITRFAQVRAPRWHARNVVLLGDAAHCIDPLSGAGAHGGLLGAAVLAEELLRTPGQVSAAATRYRRRVRRFTRPAQLLTAGLVERATARTLRDRLTADRALVGAALTARRTRVPRRTYTPAATSTAVH